MSDAGTFPPRQFWATARDGEPADLSSIATPLLRKGQPIAFVGGKLASALIRPLKNAKFPPVSSDRRHPVLADISPEDAEYEVFGHGYGEVHTAREFRQLIERAARTFAPEEDRWREDDRVVDPFRPGLRYAAASNQEFDVLQERHLNAVRTAFRQAKTVLVALSQSEVWESRADGAVFPRWTLAAERHFDPDRHAVRSLTVEETVLDLTAGIRALRSLNPGVAVVLMVSPEPQLASVHAAHVLVAGMLGKAVLRVAMEVVAGAEGVSYFPALEIAAGRASASAYGTDGSIPPVAIVAVVEALLAISEDGAASFDEPPVPVPVLRTLPVEPRTPKRPRPSAAAAPQASADMEQPDAPAPSNRQGKPKPKPLVAVVDSYTEAKSAEAREKANRRVAQRAVMGDTSPPPVEAEEPTLSQSERQVMRREKMVAREARLAAAAAIPPEQAEASAAARRKREAARASEAVATPPVAAQPTDAQKARRKVKKARLASDEAIQAGAGKPGSGKPGEIK